MAFRKKDKCNSIKSVVERNTGMTIAEFMREERKPHIDNLEETAYLIQGYIVNSPDPDVTVIGDYDCDGDTSTAIMYWTLKGLGVTPKLRIPKRFSEGYGMSVKIIDEMPDTNGLIITVDNGISSYDAVKRAKEKGYTVVITDHHLPPKDEKGSLILPPADIILDPHVYPEKSEFEDYCGAGLAYRLSQELLPDTNLIQLLVLASIGTVSDVVPLVGANRTLVKDGLQAINQNKCVPGLTKLLRRLQFDGHMTEDDYGFTLGPIFNASGRLYDDGASKIVDILTSGNTSDLDEKALNAININNVRKGLVREGEERLSKTLTDERPIVVYDENLHEGLIGIIAGHLSEKYNCPAVVFTKSEDSSIIKGSARSIPEIHLKNILDEMKEVLVRYGGHAGAAGLSIKKDDLERFREMFREKCGPIPEITEPEYDLSLGTYEGGTDIYGRLVSELKTYAPYGECNPKIIFHQTFDVSKGEFRVMGDGSHFSIRLPEIKLLGFGLREKYESLGRPQQIDCIGHLSENWFNGRVNYQFEIKDLDNVKNLQMDQNGRVIIDMDKTIKNCGAENPSRSLERKTMMPYTL